MPAMRLGAAVLLLSAVSRAAPAKTVDLLTRGQEVSSAVATVTSTAISPLLGVCLLGIYDYTRTAPEARAALPFYSRPHFWIPIGILLLLIFFKVSIGGAVPLLKKPLDAVEVLIVNKAALILLAFPVIYHEVARLTGIRDIASLIVPPVYASTPGALETAGHIGTAVAMLLAGTIITLVVWVVGHAANVLALLSPVPYFDLGVKLFRAAILLTVAGCAIVNPTLGLIASLIVIGVSALLFWSALRLLILGSVFALDVLTGPAASPGSSIRAFTMGKIQGIARRTLGRLSRDTNGILEFRYRRMMFGPVRRVRLEDAAQYEVGRGLLYPSIVLAKDLQFRLLPRYRGSEEKVRAALGMSAVRDLGFGKLMKSAKASAAPRSTEPLQ
jgi:hypothetical protein